LKTKKRIFTVAAILIGAMLIGCALFIIAVPRLIDSKALSDRLRQMIAEHIEGDLRYEDIRLSFFPIPHVKFNEVNYLMPQRAEAYAQSIEIYPSIFPLLTGSFSIKNATVHQGDVTLSLPSINTASQQPQPFTGISGWVQELFKTLHAFPEFRIPHMRSKIIDSRLQIHVGDTHKVDFSGLTADFTYQAGQVAIQISGASSLAETFQISGWLDSDNVQGDIQLDLNQIGPQAINQWVLKNAAVKIQEGLLGLHLDIKLETPEQIQVKIEAETPHLKVLHKQRSTDLAWDTLSGFLQIDRQKAALFVREAMFSKPQAHLTGHLEYAWDGSKALMQASAEDLHLDSLRPAILTLAGGSTAVQAIFEILQGGVVQTITFEAGGQTLTDLGKLDNMVIIGGMHNGTIFIPKINYQLTETSGEVVIRDGILSGDNLQARIDTTTAQNGRLKLGLKEKLIPLDLECDIQLDASQLPHLLNNQVIGDEAVQKELQRLDELSGSAQAHLTLSKEAQQFQIQVDATQIQLHARYPRIPLPVDISHGQASFNGQQVSCQALAGAIGKSTFADLSGELDWQNDVLIQVTSGESRIVVEEMVPWLTTYSALQFLPKYYGGGKTIVSVSNIQLKGPLHRLSEWDFQVDGTVEDLVINKLPYAPGKQTIKTATFQFDPQLLKLSEVEAHMLDAIVFVGTSIHKNYLRDLTENVNLRFKGRLGPKYMAWLTESLSLPDEIKFKPLSIANADLRWIEKGAASLSGTLTLALVEGLTLSTSIAFSADKLNLKKLSIQDRHSKADLRLATLKRSLDLSFSGHLAHATLDHILLDNQVLNGWLDGQFHTQINSGQPVKLTFNGHLAGEKVRIPIRWFAPLGLQSFSIKSNSNQIHIESADINWDTSRFELSGKLWPQFQDSLRVDLTINADAIDMDPLIAARQKKTGTSNAENAPQSFLNQLQGRLQLKAERFTLKGFTWRPLHLDIHLNQDAAHISAEKALLCGIAVPGTVTLSPKGLGFDVQPTAHNQDLSETLSCLFGDWIKAEGTYALEAHLFGEGQPSQIWQSINGDIEYSSKNGRIYRNAVVSQSLDFIHNQRQLKGNKPSQEMDQQGFAYHTAWMKSKLHQGQMQVDEVAVESESMNIVGRGKFDPASLYVDMSLLVAPIKTLDRVLDYVPIFGGILQSLDVVAVSLKGPYNDLKTTPLAPSAIGFQLKTLLQRTLEVPSQIVPHRRNPSSEPGKNQ
jgi:hypothetical protein